MQTLLIHVSNEEPILAEVEQLPAPTDQAIYCTNPRRRDGKDLHYLLPEVQTIILPWWRVNFVEVMPTGEEEGDRSVLSRLTGLPGVCHHVPENRRAPCRAMPACARRRRRAAHDRFIRMNLELKATRYWRRTPAWKPSR